MHNKTATPIARYDLGRVIQNFAKYRGIKLTRVKPLDLTGEVVKFEGGQMHMSHLPTSFKAKNVDVFMGNANGLQVVYSGCISPDGNDGGKYNDFSLKEEFLLRGSTRRILGFRECDYNSVHLVDNSFENLIRRFAETLDARNAWADSRGQSAEYKLMFQQNKNGLLGLENFLKVMAQ